MMMTSPRRAYLAGAVCLSVVFMCLTAYVWDNPANALDIGFAKYLQAQPSFEFLAATNGIFKAPVFRIIYPMLATGFILVKRYALSLAVMASLASEVLSTVIKTLIARPRPSIEVAALLDTSTGFSYVSGHTLEYSLLFGFLGIFAFSAIKTVLIRYAVAGIFFLLPLLVGLGRIYAGAHWLTDVIGSFLIGGAILLTILARYDRMLEHPRRLR